MNIANCRIRVCGGGLDELCLEESSSVSVTNALARKKMIVLIPEEAVVNLKKKHE